MASAQFALQANQAQTLPTFLLIRFLHQCGIDTAIDVSLQDSQHLKESDTLLELEAGDDAVVRNSDVLLRLARDHLPAFQRQGLVWEWVTRTIFGGAADLTVTDFGNLKGPMQELDSHLTLRSYIAGYSLNLADIVVWGTLRGNKVAFAQLKRTSSNISRWFNFVADTNPWMGLAFSEFNTVTQQKRATASAEGGSFDIGLDTKGAGVTTRFPPEPSGYLHIGHAKAALLNDFFAHEKTSGTLICRFDDTNPTKESQEFQDAILADLNTMKIYPDKFSHSSDYFQQMHDYCMRILEQGDAYADNTEHELMKHQRMHGLKSQCRDSSVHQNLEHFETMKTGNQEGSKWCIRAKISVDDVNKSLRDPVIYRCNPQPHHRTGATWKVYPTYDFCAPILDSIECVTHALRTNEYRDRNPQYEWMQRTLGLRQVEIFDFARVNFIRTVLSKRKLTEIVKKGVVSGWDDPRMPTVRGMHRHGLLMDTLREFMIKQGFSSNIINQDWTQIWAINKKHIDPIAPRHTAINTKEMVEATVTGTREAPWSEEKPKHAKNPSLGVKKVFYSKTILMDQQDAFSFKEDEEITLMGWGNAIVRKKSTSLNPLNKTVNHVDLELHLQGDFKKTKKKVTWLSKDQQLIPCTLIAFDHLITKDKLEKEDNITDFLTPETEFRTEAVADCNTASLAEGDIIQFERKGEYRVDKPFQHGKAAVLFEIPTGKTK